MESTPTEDGKRKKKKKVKASKAIGNSSGAFTSSIEFIAGDIARKLPSPLADKVYQNIDSRISARSQQGMESLARDQQAVMSRLRPVDGGFVAGGKKIESDRVTQVRKLRQDAAEARDISERGYRKLESLTTKQAEYRAKGMTEKSEECLREIARMRPRAEEFKRHAKTLAELADGVENNTAEVDRTTWDKIRDSIRNAPQYFGAFSAVIPTESALEHEPEAATRITHWGKELDFPFYDVADPNAGILAISGTRKSIAGFFQENSGLRFVNSLGPEDQVEGIEVAWAEHGGAEVIGIKAELFRGSGSEERYTVIGPLRAGVKFVAEGTSGVAGGVMLATQGLESTLSDMLDALVTVADTGVPKAVATSAGSAVRKAAEAAAPDSATKAWNLLKKKAGALKANLVFTVTFYTVPAAPSEDYTVCTTVGVEPADRRKNVPPSASSAAVAQAVDDAIVKLAEQVDQGRPKATRLSGRPAPAKDTEQQPTGRTPAAGSKVGTQEVRWWETIRNRTVILPKQVKIQWKGNEDGLADFREFLEKLDTAYAFQSRTFLVHCHEETGTWWAASDKPTEIVDYWTGGELCHRDKSEQGRRFVDTHGGHRRTW